MVQDDIDYDDLDFDDEGHDSDGKFPDMVDADVLASRRRLDQRSGTKAPVTKSLGSRRNRNDDYDETRPVAVDYNYDMENRSTSDQESKSKTVSTAGGAVKNAITRFFNRLAHSDDPYIVDLNELAYGMPRLEPGVGGVVVPVSDSQPSTVIAFSLSSVEYSLKFKAYLKADTKGFNGDDYQGVDLQQSRRRGNSKSLHDFQLSSDKKDIERRMRVQSKTHIKHTFRDVDAKRQIQSKFICTTFWATQFHAVRQAFLSSELAASEGDGKHSADIDLGEKRYIRSLSESQKWDASGGKSGATFARTADGRFVVKCISRTELQMFLECAPDYFEYLSKAFFHGLPTVLCKILGVSVSSFLEILSKSNFCLAFWIIPLFAAKLSSCSVRSVSMSKVLRLFGLCASTSLLAVVCKLINDSLAVFSFASIPEK